MSEHGFFCEVYGKTLRNRILEFILEHDSLDFAVSDILEEVNISKPMVYGIIRELEKESIVKKARVVAGTQLFMLNKDDEKAKILLQSFHECLKRLLPQRVSV